MAMEMEIQEKIADYILHGFIKEIDDHKVETLKEISQEVSLDLNKRGYTLYCKDVKIYFANQLTNVSALYLKGEDYIEIPDKFRQQLYTIEVNEIVLADYIIKVRDYLRKVFNLDTATKCIKKLLPVQLHDIINTHYYSPQASELSEDKLNEFLNKHKETYEFIQERLLINILKG